MRGVRTMRSYIRDNPFTYIHPTNEELEPFLGPKWCIARNTAAMRERYPGSNIISQAKYKKAEQKAIEARGYARLAEKAIRDLLILLGHSIAAQHGLRDCVEYDPAGRFIIAGRDVLGEIPEVATAREILTKARTP